MANEAKFCHFLLNVATNKTKKFQTLIRADTAWKLFMPETSAIGVKSLFQIPATGFI